MPSTPIRPPRSAPPLSTSFSIQSDLADHSPSSAGSNDLVQDLSDPNASRSRFDPRWAYKVRGEGDNRHSKLTASEHRNQERWQLESHVASLHALLTAQTEMLESMTTANLDLRKEVERATAAVREAGNERRAAEVECERLTCEVAHLRRPSGVPDSLGTATLRPPSPSVQKRPGFASAGLAALRDSTFAGRAENDPLGNVSADNATKHVSARTRLAPTSIWTGAASLAPPTIRSAPLPTPYAPQRLLSVATADYADGEGSPARPALAARRRRSLDLLKQSDGILNLVGDNDGVKQHDGVKQPDAVDATEVEDERDGRLLRLEDLVWRGKDT